MANVFIHFEPIGAVGDPINIDPDLPGYIVRGSDEERNWRQKNPGGYRLQDYLKLGTPLVLVLWVLATFLLPVFYPF